MKTINVCLFKSYTHLLYVLGLLTAKSLSDGFVNSQISVFNVLTRNPRGSWYSWSSEMHTYQLSIVYALRCSLYWGFWILGNAQVRGIPCNIYILASIEIYVRYGTRVLTCVHKQLSNPWLHGAACHHCIAGHACKDSIQIHCG